MRIKLATPLQTTEIAKALNIRLSNQNRTIQYITTDSREVNEGDMFIALNGEMHNGENYVDSAIAKGAICLTNQTKKGQLTVADTQTGLLSLAAYYKSKLKHLKYTVAITGSVGKTTTKDFLRTISEGKYITHATHKNFNNHIGMPITIFSAPEECEMLILEMGMNHSGEISALSKCAKPDIAIITNIGTAHIGNLGSKKAIAKAKLEITDGMIDKKLIIPHGEPLLSNIKNSITFSSTNTNADIYIIYNEENEYLSINKKIGKMDFHPRGAHMRECLCAAAGAAAFSGIEESIIINQISLISDKIPRQTPKALLDFYILPDYYNASLESIEASLKLLSSMKEFQRRSALIGTVRELGTKSEEIHRKIGLALAKSKPDNLYLFGKYSEYMLSGAVDGGISSKNIFINTDENSPEITANQIMTNHSPGELILFKASNRTDLCRVETIISSYKTKGDSGTCF